MTLNINLIDCPYLFAISKTMQNENGLPKIDYRSCRAALDTIRRKKGLPESEDTFLFSSGDPQKSSHFITHMREDYGFKVNFQDRKVAKHLSILTERGQLRFDDVSRRLTDVLARRDLVLDQHYEDTGDEVEAAVLLLGGSYESFDSLTSVGIRRRRNTMFVTFDKFSDNLLYDKVHLGTDRAMNGVQHYDLSNEILSVFKRPLGEERTVTQQTHPIASDV